MKRSRGHSHKGSRIAPGSRGRRLVPFKISSKNRYEGAFAPSSTRRACTHVHRISSKEFASPSPSLSLSLSSSSIFTSLFSRRRPINSGITRGHVNASCDFRSLRRHIGSVSADATGRAARSANVKLDSCSTLPKTFLRGLCIAARRIFLFISSTFRSSASAWAGALVLKLAASRGKRG